jgi:hypothetical protein
MRYYKRWWQRGHVLVDSMAQHYASNSMVGYPSAVHRLCATVCYNGTVATVKRDSHRAQVCHHSAEF